jgi:hypothetical protein
MSLLKYPDMRSLFAFALVLVSFLPAPAQKGVVPAPPDLLQISREPVRPGKMPEYTKVESEAAQACYRASTWPYFTMQSVTGPQEVWFVSGFETYAAMERSAEPFVRNVSLSQELGRLMESKTNLVTEPRTVFLRYREDLGRNNGLVRAGTRFFTVTWVSVNPGHEREFEESQRIIRGVRERAAAVDNRAVYQVISGMPGNVYLIFSPHHSFRTAAETLEGLIDYDDLDEGVRTRIRELTSTSVGSVETFVFAISPAMSNPAGEWIADDPEFWKSSPPLLRQPAAKK